MPTVGDLRFQSQAASALQGIANSLARIDQSLQAMAQALQRIDQKTK